MTDIVAREQNLFNAIDTLTQFYEEIESFLDILFGNMERGGYVAKAERLRSGTVSVKNLSRRILATATVIYIKGIEQAEESVDEDEADDDDVDTEKVGKLELAITESLYIPFVKVSLFPPRTIPSARTLSSPTLFMGALGKMSFLDRGTDQPTSPDSPVMSISNLANIRIPSATKKGDRVRVSCWSPKRMKKYKLEATLVGFESQQLLGIDTQEKIREVSNKLIGFCQV